MFRLVVSDSIEFPVKLSINDAGKQRAFTLKLQAKRVSSEEMARIISEGVDQPVAEFLREKVTGWRDQKLVVGEDDEPAEFTPEAFEALLQLFGASGAIFAAYIEAQSQAAGTGGRAKNSGG